MRRLYLLLGDPVGHSLSPRIHARAFQILEVDAVYAPCRVDAARLEEAFRGLRALGASGWNVTVPHKAAAARLCDRLTAEAEQAGAANCVSLEQGQLVGHNTDGAGLLRSLRALGVAPEGRRAVVLGAGGSAAAVALALASRGAALTVLNRSGPKGRALASLLRAAGARVEAFALADQQAGVALEEAELLVHCTTVGMGSDEMLIEPSALARGCTVVDLVYAGGPGAPLGETSLLQAARARGLACLDGLDVLVHQAIASLEIWLARPQLDFLFAGLRAAALGSA